MARSRDAARPAKATGARARTAAAPPVALPPAAAAQIDALVREVQARPDADDARLVLADALIAHGDPRGELIALQLASSTDDAHLDRIDRLLRDNARDWLGPLREITYRAGFARGFLTRLELNGGWTADEPGWARHVADPMLATVEDLIPGRAVGQVYARFLTSPAMTALRRVEVFDRPTVDALRATHANLVHVACPRWKHGKYVPKLAGNLLPACERFPALRSFAVHIDGAAAVMASSLFERLTSLTVAGSFASCLALWPRLPPAMSLTVARSAVLDDCVTTRVAWTGALRLSHDGPLVVGRATGDWLISALVERLAALPVELRRLEVEGGAAHVPALSAAAQRRGIELVLLPPVARRTGYISGLDR